MKVFNKISLIAVSIVLLFGLAGAIKAATAVSLGDADGFAVLAGTGITFGGAVNTTNITGDIGTYSITTITGIGNVVLNGTNHAGDATTQLAKTALTSAYLDAEAQTLPSVTTLLASSIDSFSGTGYTLSPGIYRSPSSIGITGTLTLDGGGNTNAVFIFQAPASTLTTAGASNIVLQNGAQACNVFWQIGSSATLGAASFFKGNILALTDITLGTTANIEGRVLARNGAVTFDGSEIVTKATCVGSTPAVTSAGGQGAHNFGPYYWDFLPLINITKIPSPLDLPLGPGSVTYNYAVTNIGPVAMSDVGVTDNKCTPVNYVSGDADNNSLLDLTETWKYECTKTVSQTVTNTATARGTANGWTVFDTANATVAVGIPLPPPLIHLVKKPNVFLLPYPGGQVTYTYTVTNPGTVPLSNVSVIDDKCTGLPGRVVGHPGDINHNDLLESNESWSFTCQTNLTQSTTNTGTAEGHANGLTALDLSPATVVVGLPPVPALPNTGVVYDANNVQLIVEMLLGILLVILTPSIMILKRRKS